MAFLFVFRTHSRVSLFRPLILDPLVRFLVVSSSPLLAFYCAPMPYPVPSLFPQILNCCLAGLGTAVSL